MKIHKAVTFCLCAVLILGGATLAIGKDKKIIKQRRLALEAVGEVAWIGYNSISIIPQENLAAGNVDEMYFSFDRKKVALEHLKSLSQISKGDILRLKFEEERLQYEGEAEQKTLKLKVISFVKKGQPMVLPGFKEDGQEVLSSEQE